MTSGRLCSCYRDKMNDDANENHGACDYSLNNNKTITTKSFEHKAKVMGSTADNNRRLDEEIVFQLTYFSTFWRTLNLPLINREKELDLSSSKNCIISEVSRTPEVAGDKPAEVTLPKTGGTFQINITNFISL